MSFKYANVLERPDMIGTADRVLQQIYEENPTHWPYGLTRGHFDGGLYLVQEKNAGAIVGFVGWQEREEPKKIASGPKVGQHALFDVDRVGYYSIGILPEYRGNRFAKSAVAQLIRLKSANVDKVRALVMASNEPSLGLARSLGVETLVKRASRMIAHLDGNGPQALTGSGRF